MELLGHGYDVESGIKIIMEKHPQVVFLDVRLGNRSGFDIIRQVPEKKFALVITSAYEEYALDAFKLEAIDYLLKPVTKEDLLKTVKRIRERHNQGPTLEEQWPSILKIIDQPARDKIAVPSADGLIFISIDQLLRCEADGVYTKLVLKSEHPVLTTRNLGEYEKILTPAMGFLRVHHSCLINMKEIVRYLRGEGGQVIMTDGVSVDISRRKKI
ncbi:MAG: LytTR family DNA-binding domain-containing protein [Bacteroidota bacterium]